MRRSLRYRVWALTLALGLACWAGAQGTRPVLGIAVDYQPERFGAHLSALQAQGVEEVVIRLRGLPTPEVWEALVESAEHAGLRWRLWLTELPRVDGWTIAPERYRLSGNPEGVYPIALADATQVLLLVSPRDAPLIRLQTMLELTEGRTTAVVGDTAESVLLLYPLRRAALPDLWEGWDAYRDGLLRLLKRRAPRTGFQGWLLQSDWDAVSLSTMPLSALAQAEWSAYLKTRYPDLVELERAWDLGIQLPSHESAARLVPLWREGRGLPFLITLDGSLRPSEVNPPRSKFWDDWHAFLRTRWQQLLEGLRDALRVHTPNAEFAVVQTAPNPAELPIPTGFLEPQLPSGWLLPASWRNEWRMQLLHETFRRERENNPLALVVLQWVGDTAERASLFQSFAREMGIERVYWLAEPTDIPQEVWKTLREGDTPPEMPAFQPFPITMWGLTQVQRYRSGWWVPSDQPDLQPLLWGFEIHGFQRGTEIRTLDAQGNLLISRQLELCLWVEEGERTITLRRFDRAPLTAFDLNGEPVRLEVRGDTVRLRVGTTPVRIRGFQAEPVCETSVEQWTQRVATLQKRGNPAGQDLQVLRFNFDNALNLYRRNPAQGFGLVRTNWFEFERAYMPYRWIEAENARQHEFGTIRRDKAVSGGATLWLGAPFPLQGASATYSLAVREAGNYTVWLAVRGTPTGSVAWQVVPNADDAKPVAEGVMPLSEGRIVSCYADQCYWLAIGSATLPAGEYQLRLRWQPAPNARLPHYAEWDVIFVAPAGIQPKHVLPPLN
ncbi:MAG: hypothetical protein RMK45_00380 [Armatimonadota bacterium]|nr:hypothetical protein [Armatimonadota bacterium]